MIKTTTKSSFFFKGFSAAAFCCVMALPLGAENVNDDANVLRHETEISAEELATVPFLLFERDSKGRLLPGNGTIERPRNSGVYQLHNKILVRPSGKDSYKLGDTVDVLKSVRNITFKGKTAQIVRRKGRAVVVGHSGSRIVIQLTHMWGIIQGGERIAPAASFKPISRDLTAVGADSKIQATVVARVEETPSPYLHQFIIIDKGTNDGINLGDFFKVFEKETKDNLSEELLEAQVVNVSSNSSTLVIRKMFRKTLNVGDQAFLSHKSVE